jgi:hypothetical protein
LALSLRILGLLSSYPKEFLVLSDLIIEIISLVEKDLNTKGEY